MPVYDGKPEGLDQFNRSVELLVEVTTVTDRAILLKFLKTRLTGHAENAHSYSSNKHVEVKLLRTQL